MAALEHPRAARLDHPWDTALVANGGRPPLEYTLSIRGCLERIGRLTTTVSVAGLAMLTLPS
jgi:hypothetical protein